MANLEIKNHIEKVISAAEEGYEWRKVKSEKTQKNFFYNPKKKAYDENLKKIIECFEDYNLRYFYKHPIEYIKYVYALYIMRKKGIDKENGKFNK